MSSMQPDRPPILRKTRGNGISRRPQVSGKFLVAGSEKLYLRGVTYGPFRPDEKDCSYPAAEIVRDDFKRMVAHGINTVRTYTVPPRWLLDAAGASGLWVMVGLPWEQHIAFLEDRQRQRSIMQAVREGVSACAGHPAVLGYAIGNEIPASIVRWYGRKRVARFLQKLYKIAKSEDPQALVTYVNYPTTEYLQLSFIDFFCFNVYLEEQQSLKAYLARLQNLAAEKPLVMAEIGLDSRRNGEQDQAETLAWQVRTAFTGGCAGVIVFAWTDEWYRGGYDILDWDFGLTRRDRSAKPALAEVSRAFDDIPCPKNENWPRISVVVCSYNGSRTMRDCCEGLSALAYPDYEVICVDDGSTDNVGAIANAFGFKVIRTANQGLSSARNTGMRAATGEIVAYIDDDARPDPHWLTYLAHTYMTTDLAGVGGPNLPFPEDGIVAQCVDNAPGGPIHVLTSDSEAEHIPGCNLSFRKDYLKAIEGFDKQFRIAGDDVDACWRIQEIGGKLGFHPAAMVWHHRRNSIKAYWKQQLNYGKAEAMLERKWPQKYNALGHHHWQGRLYAPGILKSLTFLRSRIYYGIWGSGFFQSLYEVRPGLVTSIPLMPEWYIVIAGLLVLGLLGLLWTPLLLAWPLMFAALGITITQVVISVSRTAHPGRPETHGEHLKGYIITTILHLLQPLARLIGRLRFGLTPWRRTGSSSFSSILFPLPHQSTLWSEQWRSTESRLEFLEKTIQARGAVVSRGKDFDRWDLEVRGGLFGVARIRMAVEEHGGGKQLFRFFTWAVIPPTILTGISVLILLTLYAALDQAFLPAALFGAAGMGMAIETLRNCSAASSVCKTVILDHKDG